MFQMDSSGSWSLGVLVGIPVLILLVLVIIGVAVLGALFDDLISPATYVVVGFLTVVAALGFALSPAGFYPYSAEYHQWREVSGTVEKIDNRLLKDAETKFVVRFAGSDLQFGCDDTRCAQVDEGDALTLSCKRSWQYTGTDGYDCRFVSTEVAA